MARHSAAEGGLLTGDDLARFRVGHEAPVRTGFRDFEVFACGPWCQGPVIPQALAILAGDDLRVLGHNSADYLHLVAEALKLAFADRDRFYGDPDFVDAPLEGCCRRATRRRGASRSTPPAPGRRCRRSATRAHSWRGMEGWMCRRAAPISSARRPDPTPPTAAWWTSGATPSPRRRAMAR
jgi:gamma-glutamyltranspeptidase